MTQSPPARQNKQVLIIDDDSLYTTLYRENLLALNPCTEILEASDGYHALRHLAFHRPDLIILDLYMPGFDGYAFLDVIKRKPKLADVPVLVVSSASGRSVDALRARAGVHVFRKPIPPGLLRKLLRELQRTPLSRQPVPEQESSAFKLAHFVACIGEDKRLQYKIAQQFYDLAPDRIAQLEHYIKLRNDRSLKDWCHAMTGTSAVIGAQTLHDLVGALLAALGRKDRTGVIEAADAAIIEFRHIAVLLDKGYGLSQPRM